MLNKMDALSHRYPSIRNVVYGKNIVATSTPLASQAGLDIIKKGGNAIDAAIATAATLSVVEPTGNGLGGDAFALVWAGGKLHGLNSSGFAPEKMTYEYYKNKNLDKIPVYGFDAVTVPGIPAAWAELSRKFGKLSLRECLEPAIYHARNGFALSPNVARGWKRAYNLYKENLKEAQYQTWFDHFCPNDTCPKAGDLWKSEYTASTLEEIADTMAESFYRGALADKISAYSEKYNGHLRKSDLEKFAPEWVEPISVDFNGYQVHEIPPNGHGITALMALNILKGMDLKDKEDPQTYHKMIEALKLSFVDTQHYVAEAKEMKTSVEELLSEKYAEQRRSLINDSAIDPKVGDPSSGGTVYLATADAEGNMVSYIQSNYMGFGSGIVIPETGIALHNRGNNFSLDPTLANVVAPFKRPYHTIIPGFLTKGQKPVGPFGIMGGFMQPQAHLQVIVNSILYGHNPQEALDAPRWQWIGGKTVEVEAHFPQNIAQILADKGHDIKMNYSSLFMGRGQIIWRQDNNVYMAGTESRCDGHISSW